MSRFFPYLSVLTSTAFDDIIIGTLNFIEDDTMKTRIISIALLLCLTINIFTLTSCSTSKSNSKDTTDTTLETELDIELPEAPKEERAIIHMIKPVDDLEGWQSGKTEPSAVFYVDDMMNIFDELEWKQSDEEVLISGDFDFRINLYRTEMSLRDYEKFVKNPEVEIFSKEDGNSNISVQYLINYTDKTVNMRLYDYSAEVFDVYAEMSESQMKVLILCLKYYFGAQN